MSDDNLAQTRQDRPQTDTDMVDNHSTVGKAEFAEAMKLVRIAEGLNQTEFAASIGYSRTVVGNTETKPSQYLTKAFYDQVRERYPNLPEVTEWKSRDRARKSDIGQTDDVAVFEKMLIDRSRDRSALMGRWHALWQTQVNDEEIFNSEILTFSPMRFRRVMITNSTPSRENPVAGYAWRAECRFVDGDCLLGIYASTDDANLSKGALQMKVHIQGKIIDGQWIGEGYDDQFMTGAVVLTRDRNLLVPRMSARLGRTLDFSLQDPETK